MNRHLVFGPLRMYQWHRIKAPPIELLRRGFVSLEIEIVSILKMKLSLLHRTPELRRNSAVNIQHMGSDKRNRSK
jgi:hypothetical protein